LSTYFSRIAALGVPMVASAVFVLPLTAAFFHPDVAWTFKLLLAAALVGSGVQPLAGLIAVTLLLPFSTTLEQLLGWIPASAEISDALLLAFVAGASLRVPRTVDGQPSRLAWPALAMAAAILTSAAAELRALQAVTPREPILDDVWRHLTTGYWTEPRQWTVVHHAMRWSAWLVTAVYAERLVRAVPARHALVFRLWLAAGMTGALLSAVGLAEVILRSEVPPVEAFLSVMQHLRLTVLQPDLNAAGSYFVLFLVPAIVVGIRRRLVWMLVVVAPLIGLAFMLARSRAAIAAVVLVLCAAAILFWRQRSRGAVPTVGRIWRVAAVAVLGAVAMAAMFFATTQSHIAASDAVQIRVEMTEVALTAARRHPIFGVGLGDYIRATRRFITRDMKLLYGFAPNGENAHNNFLQIIVELGIPAGLVFLWLVLPIAGMGLWTTPNRQRLVPEAQGMALGAAAFLISALFGHPLLISQVGTAFFTALGIAAGLAPTMRQRGWTSQVAWGVVGFYVATLPWR
jgi:hypothetical protein